MTFLKNFTEISKTNTAIAGGKGASLGEMTQAGIPVPPGYVVLSEAYDHFIHETDLIVEIEATLDKVDIKEIHTVEHASERIQALIKAQEFPQDLKKPILKAFKELDSKYVAVRSSATSEDSATAAWAGQLDSYLNTTESNLLENIKECWASLFTPRAIFYRFEKGLHLEKISVAVVIQKMIQSKKSGIAFSVHPVTEDPDQIIIEAGFGLGEAIVSGSVTPDSYVITKSDQEIVDINVSEQSKAFNRSSKGGNEWTDLKEEGKKQVLSIKQIKELGRLITKIEQHYNFPCDIEWAWVEDSFYIVQSRPITTLSKMDSTQSNHKANWELTISRNIPPFGWAAGAYYERKGLTIGPVTWKRNREIIIKNGGDQTHVIFDTNEYYVSNILEVFPKQKSKLEAGLDKIISLIDKSIKSEPVQSKKELLQLNKNHQKSFGYMLMCLDIVNELVELLQQNAETDDFQLSEVLIPIKYTTIQRENKAIIEGREQYRKDKSNLEKIAKSLESQFGFIHQDYLGKSLDSEGYKKEILDNKNPSATNQITNYKNHPQSDLIRIIQKIIYIYEEGRNSMVRLAWAIVQSSDVHELKKEILLHLTPEEFENYLNSGSLPNLEEVKKRQKHFLLFFNDSKLLISSDIKEIEKFIEQEQLDLNPNSGDKANTIYGSVANKGKVKGKARLVFTQKDSNKVKKGEIIVSPMTAVEFLNGIRNAAAIVTDEGGIICHAAIVSRELNLPCVIGTKTATKVIKNGDVIEVDATKGCVIINRSK